MATPPPLQTTFVHAAYYASVCLQMTQDVFPGKRWIELSEDQRRIVQNETDNLLTRSKWRLESKTFSGSFGIPTAPEIAVSAGTVLGLPPSQEDQKAPGQYA